MILLLEDGKQLRGDFVLSAVLRSDLTPVPCTLEAEIRAGDEYTEKFLRQGKRLSTAHGDDFTIIKSEKLIGRTAQGEREMTGFRVTALLTSCLPVAFVRDRAIIKENAGLSAIYRSAGATIRGIEGDFPVARFYCPIGETPTFHIAKVLQEEGGVVRWKAKKLKFFTLKDMMQQKPCLTFQAKGIDRIETGFLERHSVPWFLSLNESGEFVFGNREKARKTSFSPFKNAQKLRNMTRCLVRRMTVRVDYDIRLCAGDIVQTQDGEKLAVMTAAHVFKSGFDNGATQDAYTRLWLGQVEE